MENNPHFSELLRILSAHKVEFLIVGGYAVMKYNFRMKGKRKVLPGLRFADTLRMTHCNEIIGSSEDLTSPLIALIGLICTDVIWC